MTLEEWVRACGGALGRHGDEVYVRCPCCGKGGTHASIGKDKKNPGWIVFYCQKCHSTQGNMANALHIKHSELVYDRDLVPQQPSGGNAPKRRAPARPKSAPAQKPAPAKQAEPEKLGEITSIYEYTDANGCYLFEVCRYTPKAFRQRVRRADGGYTYSVQSDVRDRVIFRQPETLDDIAKRRIIYVAEGEKDVLRLVGLGFASTCIAGGASKAWSEAQLACLRGADVVVIPDNDPADETGKRKGQEYAFALAKALLGYANSVRLIDIKGALDALPDKGDISDWFDILGDEEGALRLEDLAQGTELFSEETPMFWLGDYELAAQAIASVPGYRVMANGGIGVMTGTDESGNANYKAITDFVAVPESVVTVDDGVQQRSEMRIVGWMGNGKRLREAIVPQSEYEGMGWVTKSWGIDAQVLPGQANKDKARYAIASAGRNVARRLTKYVHTGWRKIGGKWCYLYNGGAIGADGVTVDMPGNMSRYSFDVEPEIDAMEEDEACVWSMDMKRFMSPRLYYALASVIYMAPLVEFLGAADLTPGFTLFLHGESGAHKSTASALALSHFGNFSYSSLPASFTSTANSIREMCFMAKDVPIVIDDFHPTGDTRRRKQMEDVVDMLARAYGDRADRLRMNSDLTLRASRPVRGVAIFSGEDYPNVGASGNARLYTLDMTRDTDMPIPTIGTPEYSEFQNYVEYVRMGVLRKAMIGFIRWIIRNADIMPQYLRQEYIKLRDEARRRVKNAGMHDRFASMLAMMMLALEIMWKYFKNKGIMTDEEIAEERDAAWASLLKEVTASSDLSKQDEAGTMFLRILGQQIAVGAVYVEDLKMPAEKPPSGVERIGFMDDEYYYFIQDNAFRAVVDVTRPQGFEFPKGVRGVMQELKDKGKIRKYKENRYTIQKRIHDRILNVVCIERKWIDGDLRPDKQEGMDFTALDEDITAPF